MTVEKLIEILMFMPPKMEVYTQTMFTSLNKVRKVEKDERLGIVELKWDDEDHES